MRSNIEKAHLWEPVIHGAVFRDAGGVGVPASPTGLACSIQQNGYLWLAKFTLTAVVLTVTDAAGSGSSASLKLLDFAAGLVVPLGSYQNYTAFAEGAALTGGAGDAAFVLALGSVAANAGDGALSGTEVDIAPATGTITLSGGTGTGAKAGAALATVGDGATPVDLYLNWSGTAATIDANSTISVTGTISVLGAIFPL